MSRPLFWVGAMGRGRSRKKHHQKAPTARRWLGLAGSLRGASQESGSCRGFNGSKMPQATARRMRCCVSPRRRRKGTVLPSDREYPRSLPSGFPSKFSLQFHPRRAQRPRKALLRGREAGRRIRVRFLGKSVPVNLTPFRFCL